MTFTYVQFSDFSNSQPSIKGELAGISDRRFVNRGFSGSLEQTRNAGELGETQRAMTLSEEYMGVLCTLLWHQTHRSAFDVNSRKNTGMADSERKAQESCYKLTALSHWHHDVIMVSNTDLRKIDFLKFLTAIFHFGEQ